MKSSWTLQEITERQEFLKANPPPACPECGAKVDKLTVSTSYPAEWRCKKKHIFKYEPSPVAAIGKS